MAFVRGKPATFDVPRKEIFKVFQRVPEKASLKDVEEVWRSWLCSQDWWLTSGYVLTPSGSATFAARVHKLACTVDRTRREMGHNKERQAKYMSKTYELEIRESERDRMADKLDDLSAEIKRMQAELIAKDLMAKITSQVLITDL